MNLTERAVIKGAWFMMGSNDGHENERPIHRVWVDTFELSVCQVTNGEYALFVEATGHSQPPFLGDQRFNDLNQPVVAISWFDAVSYCEWLSRVSGRRFRLPTESEWEFAARVVPAARRPVGGGRKAGETLRLRSGQAPALHGPEPVGQGLPNAYGLYDMCENVHEWCSDWFAADFYSVSPERNPRGPETGTRRVSRGGAWRHQIKISRPAARSSLPPTFQYNDYGFRIVCDRE